METISEPKTETVIEIDFYWLGNGRGLTVRPERGDTISRDEHGIHIRLKNADGTLMEEVDVEVSNLLYTSSRKRVLNILDPKLNPVNVVVAENERRRPTEITQA